MNRGLILTLSLYINIAIIDFSFFINYNHIWDTGSFLYIRHLFTRLIMGDLYIYTRFVYFRSNFLSRALVQMLKSVIIAFNVATFFSLSISYIIGGTTLLKDNFNLSFRFSFNL